MEKFDTIDRRILTELQRDATISLEDLGDRAGVSRNACWRRVKALEASGVIKKRVALLDPAAVDQALTVFVQVRTADHDAQWLQKFATATRSIPEIQGVYRMTGDLDYLIRMRVRDVAEYDRLYQKLIEKVKLRDVSASFVMEEIKETTELPV